MGGDKKEEIKHIEGLIRKEKDPCVRDRLRGILLLKKGYTQGKVAEIMGVTTRTVYNWKTRSSRKE